MHIHNDIVILILTNIPVILLCLLYYNYADLAHSIKYIVEEYKHCPPGNLGDVIERLTGIVAHTSVWVFKTSQNWLNQFGQIHTN